MDFQITKENFKDMFINLIDLSEDLCKVVAGINTGNTKLKEFLDNNSNHDFEKICDNLKINLVMIERNCMKCVIFGKTSNGKSTILNALLKQVVVPSSKGRTTSCFISVQGCDEDVGYIMDGNERKDINLIKEKVSEFSKEKYDVDHLVQVFWPRSSCGIFKNDIEIFDSPGVDYSKGNDKCIDKYCRDADVFILAVDGCSTLNESEKSFFVKLSQIISIPSMIVLVNKWDLIKADASVEPTQIQKQHYDEVKRFLTVDLKLYNEDEMPKRIYFISALKVLQQNCDSLEIEEFEKFQKAFESDLSSNAIRTKFKRHLEKGMDIAERIFKYSSAFPAFVHKKQKLDAEEMKQKLSIKCKDTIFKVHIKIDQESKTKLQLESSRLASRIREAIERKHNYNEKAIKFIEEYLIECVCKIYRDKMKTLTEELRTLFIDYSCITMTIDQMEEYFQKNLVFPEVINEYERDIEDNFKNTSMNIKNVFQEQNDDSVKWKKIRKILGKSGPVLMAAGTMIVKTNPTIAAAMQVAGAVAQGVDLALSQNESQVSLQDDINKELSDYFSTIIEMISSKNIGKVDEMVINLIGRHVVEQVNMLELYERFDQIRTRSEYIRSRFRKIHEDNSDIFR